uniref:BEACH domain-containing protein n=1 Tax=Ananas comosus var. bracteatus TaxID=296719 RepID=A0A6V7QW00_ANACO
MNLPRIACWTQQFQVHQNKKAMRQAGFLRSWRSHSQEVAKWGNQQLPIPYASKYASRAGIQRSHTIPSISWVLADYESETLDLSNPQTFRKLDKPMGCQTADGEEEFRKRPDFFICRGLLFSSLYESWDDPDVPKFHYGNMVSAAGKSNTSDVKELILSSSICQSIWRIASV